MFPDEVFKERLELCSKIASVSPEYLNNNFTALLNIISEFQRSLALELKIIHQVKRLDIKNRDAVNDFATKFKDYVDQRRFNLERTRCSQIRKIYSNQITSRRAGTPSDQNRVDDLEDFLRKFTEQDIKFTEQIEPVMDKALAAVQDINDNVKADQTSEARQRQTDFILEYEAEVKRLNDTIKKMNQLGNDLIDQL